MARLSVLGVLSPAVGRCEAVGIVLGGGWALFARVARIRVMIIVLIFGEGDSDARLGHFFWRLLGVAHSHANN